MSKELDTSIVPPKPSGRVYLERLEYGKPCTSEDGDVVQQGLQVAEYQILYSSPNFPKPERYWVLPKVRISPSNNRNMYIAHMPFVREVSKNPIWIGLTQAHKQRKELASEVRGYTVSRWGAQLATPTRCLNPEDLLNPYSTCVAILDTPLIGWPENHKLKPFSIERSEIKTWTNWAHAPQAVRAILNGTPVCIKQYLQEDGSLFPSLEDFTIMASVVWQFLPLSLRPWFSWGWNVANLSSDKTGSNELLQFFATSSVPEGAMVFDPRTSSWLNTVRESEKHQNKLSQPTHWEQLLKIHKGEQTHISDKYGDHLSYRNIFENHLPFGPNKTVEHPSLLNFSKKGMYRSPERLVFVGLKQLVIPRRSIQSLLYGIHLTEHVNRMITNDEVPIAFGQNPLRLPAFKTITTKVLNPHWAQCIDGVQNGEVSNVSRLLHVSWCLFEMTFDSPRTIRPNQILTHLPKDKSLQSLLSVLMMCAQPLESLDIPIIQKVLQSFITHKNTPLNTHFLQLLHDNQLPQSLELALEAKLNKFSWPYETFAAKDLPQHAALFQKLHSTFEHWSETAQMRNSVLQFKAKKAQGKKDSKRIETPQIFEDFKESTPSIQELLALLPTEEVLALMYIILNRELMLTPNLQSAVHIETKTRKWYWTLALHMPENIVYKILDQSNASWQWIYFLRNGVHQMFVANGPWGSMPKNDRQNPELIWLDSGFDRRLMHPSHCPPFEQHDAWMRIAELCYSYFDLSKFLSFDEDIQNHLQTLFPKYTPQFLVQSNELGSDLPEHQQWTSPFEHTSGSTLLERGFETFIENQKNQAYSAKDSARLNDLFMQYIQRLPQMVDAKILKEHDSLYALYDFIVQAYSINQQTVYIPHLNSKFYPIIQALLKQSSALEQKLAQLWKNLTVTTASKRRTLLRKTCLLLFDILCRYDPLKHKLQTEHVLLLLTSPTMSSDHREQIQRTIRDIRETLSLAAYEADAAQKQTHVEHTLYILESLLLKPKMFALSESWIPAFSNTMSALCFSKAPLKAFKENHHSNWKKYFNLDAQEMLQYEAKFVRKYRCLPTSQRRFIMAYNKQLQPGSKKSDLGFAIPKKILPKKYQGKPFEFLMYNWNRLNKSGYTEGRFPSLQTFLRVQQWSVNSILVLINILAFWVAFTLKDPLAELIPKDAPDYTSTILLSVGVGCLFGLTAFAYTKLFQFFEHFRPTVIRVVSTSQKKEAESLIEENATRKKKRSENRYYKKIVLITISDDLYKDFQTLATSVTWNAVISRIS